MKGVKSDKKIIYFIFILFLFVCISLYHRNAVFDTNSGGNIVRRTAKTSIDLSRKYIPLTEEEAGYRYVVYECTVWCTGWGNRLNGIYAGYVLALLSGRAFRIQTRKPCHLDNFLTPNKVRWNKEYPTVNKRYTNPIYEMKYNELKDLYDSLMSKDVQVISYAHYSERIIAFLANQRMFRKLFVKLGFTDEELNNLHLYNFPIEYNIFDNLFTLNTELREEKDRIVGDRKLMCAHIRLAETGEKPKKMHLEMRKNMPTVWANLTKFMNADENKDYYLFVATDTHRVAEKYKSLFPERAINVSGSLANIQRWHKKSGRPSTSDACLGLRRVILDWEILSHCRVLYKVPGSSTFSESVMVKNPFKLAYTFSLRKKKFDKQNYHSAHYIKHFMKYPLINCTLTEPKYTQRC